MGSILEATTGVYEMSNKLFANMCKLNVAMKRGTIITVEVTELAYFNFVQSWKAHLIDPDPVWPDKVTVLTAVHDDKCTLQCLAHDVVAVFRTEMIGSEQRAYLDSQKETRESFKETRTIRVEQPENEGDAWKAS
jgi:hypothetical protein